MAVSPEIIALVERLNQELAQIDSNATEGLNLVRARLSLAPDNPMLIQFLISLNNVLLFGNNSRQRIQATIERLSTANAATEEIQETGEDLGRICKA